MIGTEHHGELGRRLGKSDPLAIPELIQEMKRRGHSEADIKNGGVRQPAVVLASGRITGRMAAEPSLNGQAAPATGEGGVLK